MTMRFAGRSCLVTGAASGIGRATAQLLAREGARVIAVDLAEEIAETAAGFDTISPVRADAGTDSSSRGHRFGSTQCAPELSRPE